MTSSRYFSSVRFLTSALQPEEWPPTALPEIALTGRSNVGKSSLINHLLETKGAARVSSKPGKTRRFNFFTVADTFFLVDLPGYGYAAASKKEQKQWSYYLDRYIHERPLTALLFLLDMRRTLSKDDHLLLEWILAHRVPTLSILTKADKLNAKETRQALEYFQKTLAPLPQIPYSIKQGQGRLLLRKALSSLFHTNKSSCEVISWA